MESLIISMEKVYEHEVRTTTFGSPSRDGSGRERVSEYRREVRTSRSPISGTKRQVEERVDNGSGRKTTTIVYDGPHGTTTTVIRRNDDKTQANARTPTKTSTYQRTEEIKDIEQPKKTVYSSVISHSSAQQSDYEKYSPSRPKQHSGTKVVYEGDPAFTETRVIRTQYDRNQDDDLDSQASRSYRRTTIERSPGKRVERTFEYNTKEDSREPERQTYTRHRESPKVTTIERTVVDSPGQRKYERTEIVREEQKPSPAKTSVTRITRDSPYGKQTTEITRTVADPQPERTVYSRTVRESSPNRYEVISKTIRESPVGKRETVTRIVREDDEEEIRSNAVRRSTADRHHDDHHHHHHHQDSRREEEPVQGSSYTRTLINRDGDEVETYSRTEKTPANYSAEEYPRRVRPSEDNDDVVVLKYTSPYKK
jgi:hypothetical protein